MREFRTGQGIDVHSFTDGDGLVMGGAIIPFNKKWVAHSDGDIIVHSLMDALLGAAGLKDIGHYFPDTDPQYKNINSLKLLEKVASIISEKKYKISNVDITVVLQEPKLAPYIDEIVKNIKDALHIDEDMISVKTTTTEHLGFIGEGKGGVATTIATIYK